MKRPIAYCPNCGAKASGVFCSQCGEKLDEESVNARPPPGDWENGIDFEDIMRRQEVRQLVAQHASRAKKRLSGEAFLQFCDKALAPLTGGKSAKVASLVQPVYAAIGISTGKVRKEVFAAPPGKVLVAVICSLAERGQELKSVEQGSDGCLLKAGLPSDMFSFSGDLVTSIQRAENGVAVEAAARIKGQLFDWGKSKRSLGRLFTDVRAFLDRAKVSQDWN